MPRVRTSSGFSLIELVIVIIVVGILAASAAIRLGARTEHSVIVEADQLRRNLSHVQMLALSWSVRLRVAVAGNGLSYSVTCRTALARAPCNAVGDTVIDPATGQNFTVVLANGVSLAPASGTLDFDSWGRPTNDGGLLSANPVTTYTLSGGGRTATVAVRPITGFAIASY